jgi:hypothetical protein
MRSRAAEVLDSRAQDALEPAEVPQQRTTARGPESGDRLQHRSLAGSRALPAVPTDREAVCLVAHALDQVQGL